MSVVRFARTVVVWGVLLVAVAALLAAVLVPRVAGATPYTVLTGSMRPHYPPGTLVVIRPTDPDRIEVGDVVTYQLESGRPTVVTHRVVAVAVRTDGERVFTTRGDANDVADQEPVRAVQIRGTLWYHVPYLGWVNNWLTGDRRTWATWAIGAGLAGYALYMFTSAARDKRRARRRPVVSRTLPEQE